jgi:hypothetical protein
VIFDKITLLLLIYQVERDLELILQLTRHFLLLFLRLLSLFHIELSQHVFRYAFLEISKFILCDSLVFLAILSIPALRLSGFKHFLENALDLVFRKILI